MHRQTAKAEHGRTETLICANKVRLAYFFALQLLALPIVILKKLIISDMHHRITTYCISICSKIGLVRIRIKCFISLNNDIM